MIVLLVLLALEILMAGYIATRFLRYQVAPTPVLRATTFTSVAVLIGLMSVTEPIEAVLRAGGALVWLPTLLKHLSILGCCAGVLLLALAERGRHNGRAESAVWALLIVVSLTVAGLHVSAGGGGMLTSVDYVEWSHSVGTLRVAMVIAYIGGLGACAGLLFVLWPLDLRTAAGRGLAILASATPFLAGWCLLRMRYVWAASQSMTLPSDQELLVTQLLSLAGGLLLTVGLIWSTAETDVAALRHWRQFRSLNHRALDVVPAVRKHSDFRFGVDMWVHDRAIEVLDALHQIQRTTGHRDTGFPRPPAQVSDSELTAVVADLGKRHSERTRT